MIILQNDNQRHSTVFDTTTDNMVKQRARRLRLALW